MYNKIAQIILNSGKATGSSGVYVAQPDSLKEGLAGKIFILGEIGGKKADGEKIISFLISDLDNNYYNDEKILLRGKIEGLKVENIFEAALAKTNKNLNEFLIHQKIKINLAETSLTVGIIYENKLHFAGFGKNRALLIYRRAGGYEIINVETSAENINENKEDGKPLKMTGVFSSVISGEIPLGSYFIFASESLPEYLSGREMVEIVTKLPPVVAAEQIKNTLLKMNTYVPFLGIIIKNTTDSVGQEIKEPIEEVLSAHNSISSLNYTEQKTEQMLAPAGIISIKKISNLIKSLLGSLKQKQKTSPKKVYRESISSNEDEVPKTQSRLELDRLGKLNLPGANSFSRPEKITLKQNSYRFFFNAGKLIKLSPNLVHKSFWAHISSTLVGWAKKLNLKNKFLLIGLVAIILIFAGSIIWTRSNSRKQKATDDFQTMVASIEAKENLIDSHLLYNDEEGAAKVLADAQALIEALPRDKTYQQEDYNRLVAKLGDLEKKIQKIITVSGMEKIQDISNLNISNLVYVSGKLYGVSASSVYTFTLDGAEPTEIKIEGASNLKDAKYDGKDLIYFRDGGKIFKFNVKDSKVSSLDIKDYNEADNYSGFSIYAAKVYLASQVKNKIFNYSNSTSRVDWLKEEANLSKTTDLFVDGRIYALASDGSIKKFYIGKAENYPNRPLAPAVSSASRLLGDAKQLYIIDQAAKRLAILALDDGHLMSQYIFDSLGELKDVTVDDTGKTIYILASDGIYKLPF